MDSGNFRERNEPSLILHGRLWNENNSPFRIRDFTSRIRLKKSKEFA